MNDNYSQQPRKTAQGRRLVAAALALGCAFGTITQAQTQRVASPTATAEITPPEGNFAFLVGHAVDTQGYVCLPKGEGASWTVNNARREATLFTSFFGQEFQIITHFLSPDIDPNQDAPNPVPFGSATWQSSFDGSRVWAQPLQSIGSQEGPYGGRFLAKTTFVQRLNAKGGIAPDDGCSATTDVGKQALVPYTADYYFFREGE